MLLECRCKTYILNEVLMSCLFTSLLVLKRAKASLSQELGRNNCLLACVLAPILHLLPVFRQGIASSMLACCVHI